MTAIPTSSFYKSKLAAPIIIFIAMCFLVGGVKGVFAGLPSVGDVFTDPLCGSYAVFDIVGRGCMCERSEPVEYETLVNWPTPSWAPCLNIKAPYYNEFPPIYLKVVVVGEAQILVDVTIVTIFF